MVEVIYKNLGVIDYKEAWNLQEEIFAKTIAIKDACDHFGNLFGANLNRRDNVDYKATQTEVRILTNDWDYASSLLDTKADLLSEKELTYARRIVENKEKTSYKKLALFLEGK
jgi:hypothetical protein